MKKFCLLMLLAGVTSLSGCASLMLSKPTGQHGSDHYSESDAKITNAVNSALVRDKQVPALDIRVVTQNAVVTLTGDVENYSVRNRAGNIAAGVSGVKAVKNYLRVRQ